MNTTQRWLSAFGFATSVAMTGCNFCNAEEERAVAFSSFDSLTVVSGGTTRRIGGSTRLTSPPADASAFQFVFNTIEGSAGGEGITLAFSGPPTATSNELVILAVALPVSLRQGEEYAIGATFTIEPSVDGDPRLLGPYDLQQANRAEAAFTIATYSFPPAQFTTNFRAVTSTGTVRVTARDRGRLELLVNLSFTDAAGKTATVTGRVQVSNERRTPPCFQ